MRAIMYSFVAGSTIVAFNMLIRFAKEFNSRWIILIAYITASIASIILSHIQNTLFFNVPIILLGIVTGLLTISLINILAKALAMGSSSTVIAVLNASSLVPSLIMFFNVWFKIWLQLQHKPLCRIYDFFAWTFLLT